MKRIFLLTVITLLIGGCSTAKRNNLKFYETALFEGRNGNIEYIEETTWKIITVDGKDTIDVEKPYQILYRKFDTEGRVDSTNAKIETMTSLISKIYYDSDKITRTIRNHVMLDRPEVVSETISLWIDDNNQTTEEKDLKTGELISKSTIRYDFENKTSTIESTYKMLGYDEIKNKSIYYYNRNLFQKLETYDADNSLSHAIQMEYNHIDNSLSKSTNTINAPLGSSFPSMTVTLEFKNIKYDEHNNRVQWEQYKDGQLEGIGKAKIGYR